MEGIYDIKKLLCLLLAILTDKRNNVASATRSWERVVQRALDKYNEDLAALTANG